MGCSRWVRRPAPAFMARTGWPAIRCLKVSFSARFRRTVARDYAPIASENEQSTRGIATSHGDDSLAFALRGSVQEP